MTKDSERIDHKSFGMISFSRVSSSASVSLFGSSILHSHFIQLEIHSASLKRSLHRDFIFERKKLFSVYLSPTQFAVAITTMNTSGVPCTIAFANGRSVKGTAIKSKRVQFDDEFTKFADNIASANNRFYERINEILDKKHIGKRDRAEILKQLDLLKMQIASNMPFIKKRFTEQMDRTVLEAKNEFDAFLEDKIMRVGLEGFKKELLALTEKTIQE